MKCFECGAVNVVHTSNVTKTTDDLTTPRRVVTVHGIETDVCPECGATDWTYPCLGPLVDLLAEGHSVAYWDGKRWTARLF